MAFIELADVSFSYETGSPPALDSVSFSMREGEYVAVVGANGSGKSSLLRVIAGLRRADAGSVRVSGLDASDPANARAVRSAINLVFQSPPDQIVATVAEEDVAFGPENLGLPRTEVARRVDESLAAVGLEAERRRPPQFLSAGQQQRLAVAGALAMRGSCLAFDEATAMLDPSSRGAMLDIMDGLNARGVGILHVTHDMEEAARARRIVAMDGGRVVYDGDPAAYFCAGGSDPSLRRAREAPRAVLLARNLGLEPRSRETAGELASRIAARMVPPAMRAAPPRESVTKGIPGGDSAFSLDGVSFSYLRGTLNEVAAIDSVSFEVPRGALVALVGRTGSGKSTLLQLMDALAFPSAGRVLSFGEDTLSRSADLRALRTRAPLAIQRPESALFEFYAGDDVAYGPRNLGLVGPALADRVRASMEAVGLPFDEFRDRRTRSLSGGEARKLALAGVLALDPEALLLDEPTSALDPAAKRAVMDLVRAQRAAGRTIVVATHSMEEAAAADLVALVDKGRVTCLAPPREFFYDRYDRAWGLGRPFACEVATSIRDLLSAPGLVEALGRPLTVDELIEGLAPLVQGASARGVGA